ncbi:MAG TPA: glycosyltransferase [Solirubrobacterales bacterium]|nr:glycosyltransferase [Solirubrobacterales bacterium]
MKIALIYDRLYPQNIGGLERYYDALARGLANSNSVSYITREVETEDPPGFRPYRVVKVAPNSPFYSARGNRRIWPTVRFGFGVFVHLLRHGRDYDVVQSASFPFFSVIAARLAFGLRRRHRPKLVVDWLEVWPREYWISYTGAIFGRVGYAIQQLCMRAPDQGVTYSAMHEARLGAHRAPVLRLTGLATEMPAVADAPAASATEPNVVFAGRHIPEKQASLIPEVIEQARRSNGEIRGTIVGDGPERANIANDIAERGLEAVVRLPGFLLDEELNQALQSAACLLLPSLREGYGLIVIEAAAYGTPCVTIDAPDNAAKELIGDGVNGFVVDDWTPANLAKAVVDVVERGQELRESTLTWYRDHWQELSVQSSVERLEQVYEKLMVGSRA